LNHTSRRNIILDFIPIRSEFEQSISKFESLFSGPSAFGKRGQIRFGFFDGIGLFSFKCDK